MKAAMEDTLALSRAITHSYYAGDMEPYFAHLCAKSVWLGTGGRVLIGESAIRSRLEGIVRKKPVQIYREDYYPLGLTSRCAAVMAEV